MAENEEPNQDAEKYVVANPETFVDNITNFPINAGYMILRAIESPHIDEIDKGQMTKQLIKLFDLIINECAE